jgi:trimeric autotransporter adhesin
MSTKTLKQRIALVAVSALTAGFLSVVSAPVANATGYSVITKDNIHIGTESANSVAAIGHCVISSDAAYSSVGVASVANSTGTVVAVGAVLNFDTVTNGAGNLVVTGPATFSAMSSTATMSLDARSVGFTSSAGADQAALKINGVGDIVVTANNNGTIGSGTAVKTFSITAVSSCADSSVPSVANSFFSLRNDDNEEGSAIDDTLTNADLAYNEVQYIAVELKNAYKADLGGSAGLLTAEGTGNVIVGVNQTGTTNIGFATNRAIDTDNIDIFVQQNTTLAPGAPLNTTITIKYNGVTLATKSLKFNGLPTGIVVDQADVTVGTSGSTGSFKFLFKDAAGNTLDGNTGVVPTSTSVTAAAAGFVSAGIVVSATGTRNSNDTQALTTKGTGTFSCVAAGVGTSGSQQVTIGAQIGATLVKSNPFTATCGGSAVASFTAAMDKAVYSPGEIATLTITAKDLNGGVVGDTAAIGAAFDKISIAGMTIIGAAIASADVFTSGVKTYKFRVDQAEGSFVGQAQVTVDSSAATAEKTVKTVQYSIKQSGTVVTNADVLKSIVSLIASINKQIQALQKLILRR